MGCDHCWHHYIGQDSFELSPRKWCCNCGEDMFDSTWHGPFQAKYPISV